MDIVYIYKHLKQWNYLAAEKTKTKQKMEKIYPSTFELALVEINSLDNHYQQKSEVYTLLRKTNLTLIC